MNNYAEVLESYIIAEESSNITSSSKRIKNFINSFNNIRYFNNDKKEIVVKNKIYRGSDFSTTKKLFNVAKADDWSRQDFIEFVKTYIDQKPEDQKFFYYDYDGTKPSEKFRKDFIKHKFILISDDFSEGTLFYSPVTDKFYFMYVDYGYETNVNNKYNNIFSWDELFSSL